MRNLLKFHEKMRKIGFGKGLRRDWEVKYRKLEFVYFFILLQRVLLEI